MPVLRRPSNDLVANRPFHATNPVHHGTDWGYGSGTNVYSMADGVVSQVITLSDYGKLVRIDHGTLIGGKHTETRYCHLSAQTVTQGQHVTVGQKIGVMGSTGSLTDEVHLHSELWLNGLRYDEQPYQTGLDTADTGTATQIETRTTMASLVQNTAGNPATVICIRDGYPIRTVAGNEYTAFLAAYGPLRPTSSVDEFNFIVLEANTARTAFLAQFPGGGSGGLTVAQDAALMGLPTAIDALPTNTELGAALTNTVTLVDQHADANKDAVISKVNGLTLTHG